MANRRRAGWLGPVFRFECVAGARRWQLYAARTFFVGLLLFALGSIWAPQEYVVRSYRDYARLGQSFLVAVTLVQLLAVMLAAPIATAGAICVDKTRGTLIHAFVTDLSDREIVLGKLASRLLTVLSLAASTFPVLALVGLLGGVEPEAALGAALVTLGAATVTCAVALACSVWALKLQHALLATSMVVFSWVLAYPLLMLAGFAPATSIDSWPYVAVLTNPIGAAIVPILEPVQFGLPDQLSFLGGSLGIAALLVTLIMKKLRPVTLGQASRPARRARPGVPARIMALLPEPPLDGNPVLWREWHRKRPSRWIGRFWTAYAAVSALASAATIAMYLLQPDGHDTLSLASWVIAAQVCFGLFLLSISAATALAEERDRGSLDVILTTPLSVREILWGKWWGTFALAPRLLIFPTWIAGAMALVSGHWLDLLLLVVTVLACSAVITSVGLAVATWVPRLGRAVTMSVLGFASWTFGWCFLVEALLGPYRSIQYQTAEWWPLGSPFFAVRAVAIWTGQITPSHWISPSFLPWASTWQAPVAVEPVFSLGWIALDLLAAFLLMLATALSFDRCLSRIPDRRLRARKWHSWPSVVIARRILLTKLH